MRRIEYMFTTAAVCMAMAGCFGPSDADRISEAQSDLILHIEGKDDIAILRHTPDDLSDMKITMDSGGYSIVPETMEELEEGLADFDEVFNGENVNLTQDNIDIQGDTARVNLTFRVTDESWDRTIPVRMDMQRQGDRWVIVGLHAFN